MGSRQKIERLFKSGAISAAEMGTMLAADLQWSVGLGGDTALSTPPKKRPSNFQRMSSARNVSSQRLSQRPALTTQQSSPSLRTDPSSPGSPGCTGMEAVEELYRSGKITAQEMEELLVADAKFRYTDSHARMIDSSTAAVIPQHVSFEAGPMGLELETEVKCGGMEITVVIRRFRSHPNGAKGQAEASGQLAVGDRLTGVNGRNTRNMSVTGVRSLIEATPRPVSLQFEPTKRSRAMADKAAKAKARLKAKGDHNKSEKYHQLQVRETLFLPEHTLTTSCSGTIARAPPAAPPPRLPPAAAGQGKAQEEAQARAGAGLRLQAAPAAAAVAAAAATTAILRSRATGRASRARRR